MFSPVLLVLAAAAATPAAAPATLDQGAIDDANKVVCKNQGTVGSRLGVKKVCRTKAEWRLVADDARREVRNMTRAKHGPNGS